MKSILQIGKYYHPDRGGIEYYTKRFAEYLSDKGHASTVVVFGAQCSKEMINGVEVNRHFAWRFAAESNISTCCEVSKEIYKNYNSFAELLDVFLMLMVKKDYCVVWHADLSLKTYLSKKFVDI